MQLLKYLGLITTCCLALLGCNNGSINSSSNSSVQPKIITLPSGTTITIPSTNFYVPHNQVLQVPITIVGGNLTHSESVTILANPKLHREALEVGNDVLQENLESNNTPSVSISPTTISVIPHATSTAYLIIDDSDGSTGTYSISITVKDVNTETNLTYPEDLYMLILEHTCSSSDLQTCGSDNRCYAYVNPAVASVNQNGRIQYNATVVSPTSYPVCFADITQQTVWNSSSENIASINSSGQITPINLGSAVITAGSNYYNINYLWSQSSELTVMASVPFPAGYGSLSVTDLSDVTYSCSKGLNKPIYMMVNNATGVLGQTVHGNASLSGYTVRVNKPDVSIAVGGSGYGEARILTAGHPFSIDIKACQNNTDMPLTLNYGAAINGYNYPSSSVKIKVIK